VGRSEAWRFGVLGVEDFASKPVELAALVAAITKIAAGAGWANSESVPMNRR
jgi:DNA-binding NarL/FixJ family response regulator